jgi:hypothetical protein
MTVYANATARSTGNRVAFEANPQKLYFPGTASAANAERLHLGFGQDRASVDFAVAGDQSGGPSFVMYSPVPNLAVRDQPPDDPATIAGQVVDTDGRGLPYAFVRLFPTNLPFAVRAARADADGRFEFTDLVAGPFRVAVSRSGYMMAGGKSAEFPMPMLRESIDVTAAPAESRKHVTLSMTRLGVLAGRVLDELSDPVEGARVQLLTVKYQGGRRRLVDAGLPARMTNDRGEYRLHDVSPGRNLAPPSSRSPMPT